MARDKQISVLSKISLGGVDELVVRSNCDNTRYKITLARDPARVIEVKPF